MATWNPKNIVLTEKGRHVLTEVVEGDGESFKITRIVAGSQRITWEAVKDYVPEGTEITDELRNNPSQYLYYAVKDLISEAQDFIIETKATEPGMSRVTMTLSNKNLKNSYTLHNIAVYVQYGEEEEVLYLIAQCDYDPANGVHADTIPTLNVTEATMHFTLYIEHSQTANIEINTTESSFLTNEVVNKPGGVAGLDDSGKVLRSVIPAVEMGTCTTAASTAAKVVTLDKFKLTDRATILVSFDKINSAAGVTLNVNGTGAKTVRDRRGNTITSTFASIVGGVCAFIYIGALDSWVLFPELWATGSVFGSVKLSDSITSTSNANSGVAATPKAVNAVKTTVDTLSKTVTNLSDSLTQMSTNTLKAFTTTFTVQADAWEYLNGSYYAYVSVEGVDPTDIIFTEVIQGSDNEANTYIVNSWRCIDRVSPIDNGFELFAYSKKPEVSVSIQVVCFRNTEELPVE